MKSTKDFRNFDNGEAMRRAAKLEPIRKSGKDKHSIYRAVNNNHDDDDETDFDFKNTKRESIFDYIDDEDEL